MTVMEKSSSQPPADTLMIAGFPVLALTRMPLVSRLLASWEQGRQRCLFFVNTNFVNQCESMRQALSDPDICLVNDGIGMDIAGWLLHRTRFPDNLNGTDLVPHLLLQLHDKQRQAALEGPRIFLLGAKPGIAFRAAATLADMGLCIVGTLNGYEESANNAGVVDAINAAGADIVLVAMGNPVQERWILDHRHQLDARWLMGVGALLDFLAGDKPRAPEWIRSCRLEWLYRLSLEPRRLFRRYTIDIGRFLIRCRRWRHQSRIES